MLVGLSQAAATVPGLSRSGTTIAVGMLCGFERSFAVKFSFLLSIPAVLGANLLTLIDAVQAGIDASMLPVYLVRRRGSVHFRLPGHQPAAHPCAARPLRQLCLLLLGRGSGDVDPFTCGVRLSYGGTKTKEKIDGREERGARRLQEQRAR